ncbi:hypothetical protein ACWPOB_04125 [Rhodococcus sp. 2H158]
MSAVLIVAGLWQFDLRQCGALAGFAVSLLLLIVVRVAIRTAKTAVAPPAVPRGVSAASGQA